MTSILMRVCPVVFVVTTGVIVSPGCGGDYCNDETATVGVAPGESMSFSLDCMGEVSNDRASLVDCDSPTWTITLTDGETLALGPDQFSVSISLAYEQSDGTEIVSITMVGTSADATFSDGYAPEAFLEFEQADYADGEVEFGNSLDGEDWNGCIADYSCPFLDLHNKDLDTDDWGYTVGVGTGGSVVFSAAGQEDGDPIVFSAEALTMGAPKFRGGGQICDDGLLHHE